MTSTAYYYDTKEIKNPGSRGGKYWVDDKGNIRYGAPPAGSKQRTPAQWQAASNKAMFGELKDISAMSPEEAAKALADMDYEYGVRGIEGGPNDALGMNFGQDKNAALQDAIKAGQQFPDMSFAVVKVGDNYHVIAKETKALTAKVIEKDKGSGVDATGEGKGKVKKPDVNTGSPKKKETSASTGNTGSITTAKPGTSGSSKPVAGAGATTKQPVTTDKPKAGGGGGKGGAAKQPTPDKTKDKDKLKPTPEDKEKERLAKEQAKDKAKQEAATAKQQETAAKKKDTLTKVFGKTSDALLKLDAGEALAPDAPEALELYNSGLVEFDSDGNLALSYYGGRVAKEAGKGNEANVREALRLGKKRAGNNAALKQSLTDPETGSALTTDELYDDGWESPDSEMQGIEDKKETDKQLAQLEKDNPQSAFASVKGKDGKYTIVAKLKKELLVRSKKKAYEFSDYDSDGFTEAQTETKAAPDYARTGVMLAFMLSQDDSDLLKSWLIEKGLEPVEDSHITLAFLGDIPELEKQGITLEKVLAVLRDFAANFSFGKILGTLSGIGRFNNVEGDNGMQAVYASFDSPQLPEFRQCLVRHLTDFSIPYSRTHGYTPHCSLTYAHLSETTPINQVPRLELCFSEVCLAWGNDHYYIPISKLNRAESVPEKESNGNSNGTK